MTKILSLNIRIWTRDLKRSSEHYWVERYRKIHNYIKRENPDIICLQEVWWPAKYALRLGKLGYKKTGWGFSHPIYVRKYARVCEHEVSIYATTAVVNDVQIFSVHPHWARKRFSKAMRWIKKRKCGYSVAAGDFNTSNIWVIGNMLSMSSARRILGAPVQDTFANYKRPTESHGEIDHIFVSDIARACSSMLANYVYGDEGLSDHRPISVEFNFD